MSKEIIINEDQGKITQVKTIQTFDYGDPNHPDQYETEFYFRVHEDLELSDPIGHPIYCTVMIAHNIPMTEEKKLKIGRIQRIEVAMSLGLKTHSEMEKYIQPLTKEEHDKIMEDDNEQKTNHIQKVF